MRFHQIHWLLHTKYQNTNKFNVFSGKWQLLIQEDYIVIDI